MLMRSDCVRFVLAVAVLIGVTVDRAVADDSVTLESLLYEMVTPARLARWPQPAYRQLQVSSYNRASSVRGGPGWFGDSDCGGVIRKERHGNHTEWVLMDHEGPGCITRIWTPFFYYNFQERTGPNVRIYLDGAEEPVINCSLIHLVSGRLFVGEPFASHTPRAGDLYLPIPFGSRCKITMRRKPFYYIINYRAYAKGTRVETFSMRAFERTRAEREKVGRVLLDRPHDGRNELKTVDKTLNPGATLSIPLSAGPAAIRYLEVQLGPEQAGHTAPLRSTILTARFDNEPTVWCPVGDFFGSADSVHPFRTFARQVTNEGTMICRWVMPYQRSAELKLLNTSEQQVRVRIRVAVGPWRWDHHSMHFHATWRPDQVVPGKPFRDWNFIEIVGKGVLVGDQWTVLNPNGGWWGEGDEKIYVDDDFDRNFPSHFGTGTEDYYGWAGGRVPTRKDEFSHPFLANIRVGGLNGNTLGYNICARHRALDAIPFTRRIRFDMEASFGVGIRNSWNLLGYSAVVWWYARPGARHNSPLSPEAARRPIMTLAELTRQSKQTRNALTSRVEDAIEFEDLEPSAQTKGLAGGRQVPHPRFHPDRFSGHAHFFVPARHKGDFVEFAIPEQYATRRMILHLVRSFDFGIVQVSVNGRKTGKPIDLYEPKPATIVKMDCGTVAPIDSAIALRVQLVGKNPKSRGTFFGLDCVELKEP